MNNDGFDPFNSNYRNDQNNNEEIVWDFEPQIDINREKKFFSRLGFGMAFFLIAVFLSIYAVEIAVYIISPEFYSSKLFLNLLSPVCIYGFGFPVLWLFLRKMETKAPEKKRMKLLEWLTILVICFGLMYIGANIGTRVLEYISAFFGGYDYSNPIEELIDYKNLWISAIFTVIVAPVGEELLFRKFLIDRMHGRYGSFISIMLSALLFGLMHGNFSQFFYAFALGIVLGYVYVNTGKVYLTMAIHAIINFVGSILTSLMQLGLQDFMTDLEMVSDGNIMSLFFDHWFAIGVLLAYNAFVNVTMICAIAFPIIFRKRIVFQKGEISLPRQDAVPTVLLNAGMITALVVFAMKFVLSILPI